MIWRTVLGMSSRGRLPILIFHRVLERPDPLLPGEPCARQFEQLLAHVRSRFNVLPLLQAARGLFAGTLPPRALSITFDDGYADNLRVAAPLLKAQRMPATVFVASGYLDGRCMFNDLVIEAFRSASGASLDLESLGLGTHALGSIADRRTAIDAVLGRIKYLPPDERNDVAVEILRLAGVTAPRGLMLTRDEVRTLGDWGIDVGVHTRSHPILARLSAERAREEIASAAIELRELTGAVPRLFAYPNGTPGRDYTHEHVAMVREAGFEFAVSTAWGAASRESDPLQLPRFTPWSRDPLKFDLLMLRNLRQGVGEVANAAS